MNIISIIRRNHALEHATITILLNRMDGKVRLVGRAGVSGFYLYGDIPTDILKETAAEALRRLQSGQRELAVSPLCGTNLVVSGLVVGGAALFAGRGHRGFSKYTRIVQASILAMLVARPIGHLAQQYITTSTSDLSNVTVKRVVRRGQGMQTRHKVKIGIA